MQVYLGADHGGFALKELLKQTLPAQGYQVEDCGALHHDGTDDYPQFAWAVSEKVAADPQSKGILLCRFGGGMTIAANKHPGIRAVMAQSVPAAQKAREDNDANVLVLSGDLTSDAEAAEIVASFLETEFSQAERHQRRLEQIAAYEKKL